MVDAQCPHQSADARIFMGDGGVDHRQNAAVPTRVMSIADGTPIKPSSGM